MNTDSFQIRADWILAARDCILSPGILTIRHGRVVEVKPASDRALESVDLDLEGYALLPGLVNPHTHLEFSDLRAPLPAGENFPTWVGSVIRQRLNRGDDALRLLGQSIGQGLAECREMGVIAVADIVTPPWTPDLLARVACSDQRTLEISPEVRDRLSKSKQDQLRTHWQPLTQWPKVIACLEVLGVTGNRANDLRNWRDDLLNVANTSYPETLMDIALSPHAPYSTPEQLWRESAELAERDGRLLVMHLAESPAEREWIDSGTGPMAEMLNRIGASQHRPEPNWIEQAIVQLARAPRALIVHGNYLTANEMDRIADYRDRLSVVYCPRTHSHFGHVNYPLEQLTDRGIRVVLGTDSRSSNPDLNLWREAAHAVTLHESLRPTQALDAITQSAAESLGISSRFGTLLPGATAAFNAVPTFGLRDLEDILNRNFVENHCVTGLVRVQARAT